MNRLSATTLKQGPTGKAFEKINDGMNTLNSFKGFKKQSTIRQNGRYYALCDRRACKVSDVKDENGRYINKIYTDNYNSVNLGKYSVRNSTRKQKFRRAPITSLIQYELNKKVFDNFQIDVDKCVVVDGCYHTNKQILKRQLIPADLNGEHFLYPTVENVKRFDETVKVVFRKMKNLGLIETQKFSDIFATNVSPSKKPGFRFEEEFNYRTKKEAIKPALRLARKRWNYANKNKKNKIEREKIFPGVYTIGARNKRDYNYENGEPATSRAVHMPEFHCELTSAPWCDSMIDRILEVAKGPIYLGNSILDWYRLNVDIKDSNYVLEGDWKRFDSTLYLIIITISLTIFRCFFEHNNPVIDRHFILMYDTLAIKDYFLPGGRIVRAFHGLPSGVKATALLGSIINLVALVYCVGPEFSKKFNFIVGGDDFLVVARSNKISAEDLIERMGVKSKSLGMEFKFLKTKFYNNALIEQCPVFFKYTIYKGQPVVPTSAVLERVFLPWNKKYNTHSKVLKFLQDVMPSLGKPMTHHLLYYEHLRLLTFIVCGVNLSFKQIILQHELVFERMNSRKLIYKLFEYKVDSSEIKKDVSELLLEIKKERKFDNTYFLIDLISKIYS